MSLLATPVLADQLSDKVPARDSAVFLEQLTSTEVRDRVSAGATTILIPVGATEQTGPYVALGKHNYRVQYLAGRIATELGNTLVAPVISYVPEGAISPPAAHMKYAGTISIPDAAFIALLEGAARSFLQHGFRNIVLLGDHGGYKQDLAQVATQLNQEWHGADGARVIHLTEYYRLSSTGFDTLLKQRGFSTAEIGAHGGLSDTALIMGVDKNLVRSDAMRANTKPLPGVVGDPAHATVELGQAGLSMIVDGSVAALRKILGAQTAPAK